VPYADPAKRRENSRARRNRPYVYTPEYMASVRERIKRRIVVNENGCWIWQGCLNPAGYGNIGYGNRTGLTHRVSYLVFVGEIPAGLTLDHLCDTPACCNPAHLKPATDRENILRGNSASAINARKTVCAYGHPFDADNTAYLPSGTRYCKACNRRKSLAVYYARKAA
jgi:hypothetical protein